MQLAHELHQPRDRALIDAAGDLVEQQQARLRRERAGEFQAFALSGGERAPVGIRLFQQAHAAQPLVRLLARVADVARACERADHHVLGDGHALEGAQLLEGARDAAPAHVVGREPGEPRPVELHLALVGRVEAADAVEERRLAGAVRPDDADELTGRDVERDAAVGGDAAEALGHAANAEQAHRSRSQPTSPWGA